MVADQARHAKCKAYPRAHRTKERENRVQKVIELDQSRMFSEISVIGSVTKIEVPSRLHRFKYRLYSGSNRYLLIGRKNIPLVRK